MKQTIPQQTIVTCDICKASNGASKSSFRTEASLTITRAALDYSGVPVANSGQSIDLCDSCCYRIEEMLVKFAQEKCSKTTPNP